MGTRDSVTGQTVRAMQGDVLQYKVNGTVGTDGNYVLRLEGQVTIPRAVDMVDFREWLTRLLMNNGVRFPMLDVTEVDCDGCPCIIQGGSPCCSCGRSNWEHFTT